MCTSKLGFKFALWGQWGHWKGFSPVCVIMWRFNRNFRLNPWKVLPQVTHSTPTVAKVGRRGWCVTFADCQTATRPWNNNTPQVSFQTLAMIATSTAIQATFPNHYLLLFLNLILYITIAPHNSVVLHKVPSIKDHLPNSPNEGNTQFHLTCSL